MGISRNILYYNIILYNVGIIFRKRINYNVGIIFRKRIKQGYNDKLMKCCVNIIYTTVIFDSTCIMKIIKGLQ